MMTSNVNPKKVLGFLKEYRMLECSTCKNVFGFMHKVTGDMLCSGVGECSCFQKAVDSMDSVPAGESNQEAEVSRRNRGMLPVSVASPKPLEEKMVSKVEEAKVIKVEEAKVSKVEGTKVSKVVLEGKKVEEKAAVGSPQTPKKDLNLKLKGDVVDGAAECQVKLQDKAAPAEIPIREKLLKKVEQVIEKQKEKGAVPVEQQQEIVKVKSPKATPPSETISTSCEERKFKFAPVPSAPFVEVQKQNEEVLSPPRTYSKVWSKLRYSRSLRDGANVRISFTWASNMYHAVADEDEEALDVLQGRIAVKMEKNELKRFVGKPKKDDLVIAQYEGVFYRGRVATVSVSGTICHVHFIDFGDKVSVNYGGKEEVGLYELDLELMEIPVFGTPIRLVDLKEGATTTLEVNPSIYDMEFTLELDEPLVVTPGRFYHLGKLIVRDTKQSLAQFLLE